MDNSVSTSKHEEEKQFFEEDERGIPVLFKIKNPVESFTGRAKELDILHKLLKEPTGKTKAVCISGIGGVGKSEVARKYISEFRMEYNNYILWFNAESYKALEACFRSLAREKLGIATRNPNGDEKGLMSIIVEVYRALPNKRCLMIFDNAQHYQSNNEFDEGIDRFLPPFSDDSTPYILITSRNKNWPSTIHVLSLDMFEKDEAVQFISKVLKTNIDESSALADRMNCYPLALQQAVSYIKVQNMKLQNIGSHFNITHYLEHLKDNSKDVLNFSFPNGSDIEYTKTVYVTWNATLDFIRTSKNGILAFKIMNILSFMAPDDIPMDLFLNLINDYDILSSALDILKQYSMITIHKKCISLKEDVVLISLHRLVQEVIRLKLMEENNNKSVLEEALMIFTQRENVNSKTLSHAISVWNYSCKPGVLSYTKIIYCVLVSTHISSELLVNHQYTETDSFVKKAMEFCLLFLMDNRMILGFLLILRIIQAVTLVALGDYNNAIKNFQEVLLSSECFFGNSNPMQFSIKHDLAKIFIIQGKYNKAIKLTTELCENDPLSFDYKITHAQVLKIQGKFDEALDILKEAEKYVSQMDSTNSIELLVHLLLKGNLGDSLRLSQSLDYSKESASRKNRINLKKKQLMAQIFENQNKYPETLKVAKEMLKIGIEVFGENHPETLRYQFSIAELLRNQFKFDKALELFEEIYKKQETLLGKDHPDTLDSLFGIAITLENQGKLNDSLRIYQEVLKKRTTKLGKDNPFSIQVCINIADLYSRMKDHDKALEKYNEVLNIKEKKLGEDHPHCLLIKYRIAKTLYLKNKFNESLKMFRELLRKVDVILGKDHSMSLIVRNEISTLLTRQNKLDEAFRECKAAMEIQKLCTKNNEKITLDTKIIFANILAGQKKDEEVLKLLTEILEIYILNELPLDVAKIKHEIAKTLMRLNKHQRAIKFAQESFLSFKSHLGTDDPKTVELHSVLQYLLSVEKLFTAVKQNKSTEFIKELVTSGCDFKTQDDEGRTLLHHAINRCNIETVRYFLSIGVDFTQVTEKGNSCLHIAVLKGKKDTVKVLLEHLSHSRSEELMDIQTVIGGMTALHVAAKNNKLGIVKDLLKYGAKYNILNNDNKRPIDVTEDREVKSILQLVDVNFNLIGYGGINIDQLKSLKEEDLMAVMNARNENGKTLLQVAMNKKDHVAVERLSDILQKMKFD